MSLGSLIGFLAVFAIAARNSVSLVSHLQHLERHEGETFAPTRIYRAARERLAPTLLAATVLGVALLPLLLLGGAPGMAILRPMAVVVLGGLVSSTLLTLFVLPLLYLGSDVDIWRSRSNPNPFQAPKEGDAK